MCKIGEIKFAIKILVRNGVNKKNIILLQCNTAYPTPFKDANLKAILTLKNKFGVKVGYSDHTPGIEASIAAVALGASVIEKHVTLSKKLTGPDHKSSLEIKEFQSMIKAIRNVEVALGNGNKIPTKSEIENLTIVRNSIVAAKSIKKGQMFTKENLTIKRPGYGISPTKILKVIGKFAKKNFLQDELIKI